MATQIALDPFPLTVTLVLGEEDWKKVCEDNDLKDRRWLEEGIGGEVAHEGEQIVVRLRDDVTFEHVDILAHEATHIFQAMCNHISEQDPSAEFAAYHIGYLTAWMYKTLKDSQCSLSTDSSDTQSDLPSSSEQSGCTSPEIDEPTTS